MALGWMPVGGDSALACLCQTLSDSLLAGLVQSLTLLASWLGLGQIWAPRLSSLEETT